MAGGPAADDSQVFFEMAHQSLVHHALSKPAGDDFVLFNGLSTIATGLEILSAELKATRKEIAELKAQQQPPKRTP